MVIFLFVVLGLWVSLPQTTVRGETELECAMIYSNVTEAVIDLDGNNINCQLTVKDVDYPVIIQYTVNEFKVMGGGDAACTDARIMIDFYTWLCEKDGGEKSIIAYDGGDSFTITLYSKKKFEFDIELTVIPYRSLESEFYKQPYRALPQVTSRLFGEGYIISHPEYPTALFIGFQYSYSLTLHNPCNSTIKLEILDFVWKRNQSLNRAQLAIAVDGHQLLSVSPQTPLPFGPINFKSSITFSWLPNLYTLYGFHFLYHWSHMTNNSQPNCSSRNATTITTTSEPVTTTSEPVTTTSEPVTTTSEPVTTDSELFTPEFTSDDIVSTDWLSTELEPAATPQLNASSQQGVPPLTIGLSVSVAVLGGVLIVGVLVILYRRKLKKRGNGSQSPETVNNYQYEDDKKFASSYELCVSASSANEEPDYDCINTPKTSRSAAVYSYVNPSMEPEVKGERTGNLTVEDVYSVIPCTEPYFNAENTIYHLEEEETRDGDHHGDGSNQEEAVQYSLADPEEEDSSAPTCTSGEGDYHTLESPERESEEPRLAEDSVYYLADNPEAEAETPGKEGVYHNIVENNEKPEERVTRPSNNLVYHVGPVTGMEVKADGNFNEGNYHEVEEGVYHEIELPANTENAEGDYGEIE